MCLSLKAIRSPKKTFPKCESRPSEWHNEWHNERRADAHALRDVRSGCDLPSHGSVLRKKEILDELEKPSTRSTEDAMNNNATEDHPLLNVGLPKWPALLIVGESVTEDQAAEIIIRTGHWPICINDRAWEREVHAILGVVNPYEDVSRDVKSIDALYETFTAWKERMGVLDMEYLYNSQVGSAYIGGPHGWCDWRGVIGCSDYNIGKYPDTVEVLHDWQKIAEAFPFLKLKSQLFNGE